MTFEVDANFRAEFVQNMCARYWTIETIRSLFLIFSLWRPLVSHFDYIDDG